MNKIGESKGPHPESSIQQYQQQFDVNTHKFVTLPNPVNGIGF